MKKILISLFLIFALCPVGSFAEELSVQSVAVEVSCVPMGGASISEGEQIPSEADNYPAFFGNFTFEEYICAFIEESETLPTVIDGLERFDVKKSEFADVYFDIALKHPELFLKTAYTSLRFNEETQVVQSVVPQFIVSSVEERNALNMVLADGIASYVESAKEYNTPLEKLLVIHDKMVADCDYDVNALSSATEHLVPESARHVIGVFRDEVAVCQGYSQALYIIAKELGIDMDFCFSKEKNHMWNYVKLNDKWYHLDMTNDDPVTKDEEGNTVAREDKRAYHMYFMVSDAGLDETIHGTDYRDFGNNNYICSDSCYESDYLFNIDVPFTAKRGNDGNYSVDTELKLVNEGITLPASFKSSTLRICAMVSAICPGQVESDTNLYLVSYPTREIEKVTVINRYDNKNSLSRLDNVSFEKDAFAVIRIASGVPSNMSIGFTSFIWETDTLVPCAEKAVWSQN